MTKFSKDGMEEKTDFCLKDIINYLKEIEKIRTTFKIQIDSKAKKLHAKMLKQLDSVDKAVKETRL